MRHATTLCNLNNNATFHPHNLLNKQKILEIQFGFFLSFPFNFARAYQILNPTKNAWPYQTDFPFIQISCAKNQFADKCVKLQNYKAEQL